MQNRNTPTLYTNLKRVGAGAAVVGAALFSSGAVAQSCNTVERGVMTDASCGQPWTVTTLGAELQKSLKITDPSKRVDALSQVTGIARRQLGESGTLIQQQGFEELVKAVPQLPTKADQCTAAGTDVRRHAVSPEQKQTARNLAASLSC